jgi:23S rRNA pseudouridine2457 synthase
MPFDYLIFYKPFQVLSQFSAEGDKKTLANFFSGIKKDIYPVGRLDYDSEGLLLLTNDKELNHRLLNPMFIHDREYWVQVEGIPTEQAIHNLANGVTITVDGKPYRTRKAVVKLLAAETLPVPERNPPIRFRKNIPTSWLSLTLTEGKNRQVRKMTAAVGLPTLRLIRYRIGRQTMEGMMPGDILRFNDSIKEQLFAR